MKRLLGWISVSVLVVMIALTVAGTWITHNTVDDQESRLLRERTNEVGLVLSTAISSLSDQLATLGALMRYTNNSQHAFVQATKSILDAAQSPTTVALLQKAPAGYRVVTVNGSRLTAGSVINDQRVAALDLAIKTQTMVPTPVMNIDKERTLGFALGPPSAPPNTVVYQQVDLGPLGPPRQANTAPFSEVEVALYDGMSAASSQAIVTTSRRLPMRGRVHDKALPVGATTWLLQVRAVHPLVGSTTANAQWFVLVGGLVVCLLVTATAEIESRRRANAIALYANEQRLAEGLQLSLLPELPAVADLNIAARYIPGTAGQQVGGDWYDVFPLDHGQIGIVIGDVVGHDISASATMSRVQAALRAYAFREDDPAIVLDRLDSLIATFRGDRLVTMFYGVLSASDSQGNRQLRFANAGHPPPIACLAGGGSEEIAGAASMLLGVTSVPEGTRSSDAIELATGSTLLLYTDGLIEIPGESMTESIEQLKRATADGASMSPSELCDRLTSEQRKAEQRDDVAVLAIQLTDPSRTTRLRSPLQVTALEPGR